MNNEAYYPILENSINNGTYNNMDLLAAQAAPTPTPANHMPNNVTNIGNPTGYNLLGGMSQVPTGAGFITNGRFQLNGNSGSYANLNYLSIGNSGDNSSSSRYPLGPLGNNDNNGNGDGNSDGSDNGNGNDGDIGFPPPNNDGNYGTGFGWPGYSS